ncbi:MAG: tetratricopeptide repeat protein [Magnetococcales bacterium]|nr:tetratricopeptide repeat protein [Magnetococcales bacterium]
MRDTISVVAFCSATLAGWKDFVWVVLLSMLAVCDTVSVAHALPPELESIYRSLDNKRLAEADEQINRYLAKKPKEASALFLKGLILVERDKKADALRQFQQLTELYPEMPEPYNNLAVLYAEQGLLNEARQALLKAIKTHPSYGTAHDNLGDLYSKMASQAYSKALQLDRTNKAIEARLTPLTRLLSSVGGEVVAGSATAQASDQAAVCRDAIERVHGELLERARVQAHDELRHDMSQKIRQEIMAQTRQEMAEQLRNEAREQLRAELLAQAREDAQERLRGEIEEKARPGNKTPPASALSPVASAKEAAATAQGEQEIAARERNQIAVEEVVRHWVAAWSTKKVDQYLKFYGSGFRLPPPFRQRSEWEQKRSAVILKAQTIRIELDNLQVQSLDRKQARVTFLQSYWSDAYQDKTRKMLLLRQEKDGWKIVQETVDG